MHTDTALDYRFRHRGLLPVVALHLALAIGALGVVAVMSEPAHAAKRTDKREVEARQFFAAGQYQQALDLYAALYADKVHPTYLRNIGRCYQNLEQPEKAIKAFRDYLRQAKVVTSAERAEVEGYIAEMKLLQEQQAAAAAAATVAAPPPEPPPVLPAVPPVDPDQLASPVVVQAPPPEPVEPAPFYKKAWFWSVVGVAVVGGVLGGLYAGGVFSSDNKMSCAAADQCQ